MGIAESDIKVNVWEDWPDNHVEDTRFLRNTLHWANPQCLGGVTSEFSAKPNFMMYFDADDGISHINIIAEAIANLLPDYELVKVKKPVGDGRYRGVCIIVHSPMKITHRFGGVGMPADFSEPVAVATGSPDAKFSLQQLRQVLYFHTTQRAHDMYREHSNPMHRMFGDLL